MQVPVLRTVPAGPTGATAPEAGRGGAEAGGGGGGTASGCVASAGAGSGSWDMPRRLTRPDRHPVTTRSATLQRRQLPLDVSPGGRLPVVPRVGRVEQVRLGDEASQHVGAAGVEHRVLEVGELAADGGDVLV